MDPEKDDLIWQQLSNRLFGVLKTTDERLFTARVMAEVRQLQPVNGSWRLFVRWAVPALTVAMASLLLALRIPSWTAPLSTDTLLFLSQTSDEDLAADTLGE